MNPRQDSKPVRLVISGCCGRMGSLLVEEALRDTGSFELVGGVEQEGHARIGEPLAPSARCRVTSSLSDLLPRADLLIEFTTPQASLAHARQAAPAGVPMLIGTTGFSAQELEELRRYTQRIPILWSPNMSIGVVILRRTMAAVYELLKKFQLESQVSFRLSETHHAQKKDKPSGTAKLLAEDLRALSGRPIEDAQIESIREGEVIGIHTVRFDLPAEQIQLTHEAKDRRLFAQGALLVARYFLRLWKEPGLYRMDDFVRALEQSNSR